MQCMAVIYIIEMQKNVIVMDTSTAVVTTAINAQLLQHGTDTKYKC